MLCPNCNSELMNVNGRNICVECGTEVPENQMLDTTTDFADATNINEQVDTPTVENPEINPSAGVEDSFPAPENSNDQATANVETMGDPETYEIPSTPSEVTSEMPLESPIQAETTSELPVSEMAQAPVEMPVVLSYPETNADDKTIDQLVDLPSEPTQEVEEVPAEPMVESVSTSEIVEEKIEDAAFSEDSAVEMLNNTEVIPEVDTPSTEVSVESLPEVSQVETPVENVQPTTNPYEVPITVATESDVQPVMSAETSTDFATTSEVAPQTIATQEPVDPFDVVDSAPTNYGVDPNLVQADYTTPAEPAPAETAAAVNYNNNRKLLIMLIAGGILTLFFAIGGIVAYNLLTKPVETPPIVNEEDNWVDYPGTDYQVKFPLTPERSKETLSVNDKKIDLQKISVKSNGATYAISSGLVPEGLTLSVELTEFINALAKANDAKIDRTEVVNFDGEAATDYLLSTGTSTVKGKVIVRSGKVYFIQYASNSDTSDNYETFINSFTFKSEEIEG